MVAKWASRSVFTINKRIKAFLIQLTELHTVISLCFLLQCNIYSNIRLFVLVSFRSAFLFLLFL